MIRPILRSIDLNQNPGEIEDITDFCTGAVAYITEEGCEGADTFSFAIMTPKRLEKFVLEEKMIYFRATFVVNESDMESNIRLIEDEINKILLNCCRENWEETALAINYYLMWEYYVPSVGIGNFYLSTNKLKKQTFYIEEEQ